MPNPLAAAGLEPEEAVVETEATEAPETEAPEPEEEIVVPEGAENPDAVKNAIQAERKKAREAYAKAKQLERELAERTEAARPLEERVADADRKAKAAETSLMRLEVGMAHGITDPNIVKRIVGDTKEEMEADAKSLLSALTTTAPTPGVTLNGGFLPTPPVKSDPTKAHNDFIGNLLSGRTPQQ